MIAAVAPMPERILEENYRVHQAEAERYDLLHREIFNRQEQASLDEDLGEACGHGAVEALDIGPGTGNITLKLLARGLRVTAVDISPRMLQVLQAKAGPSRDRLNVVAQGIDAYLATEPTLPALVTMSSLLHQLPRPLATLEHLARSLPPGGVLYITHEPTGIPISPAVRALGLLDRALWNALHPSLASYGRALDYSVSDYHARSGFHPDRISASLGAAGLRTLRLRRYGAAKYAPLARLRTGLGDTSQFALLARRPSVPEAPL